MNASPAQKRRRTASPPQATIRRAAREAQALGPAWRVAIEGNVVHLFQGEQPIAKVVEPPPVRDFTL